MIGSCVTISLVEEARGGPFVFWDDLPAACRMARELGFDAVEIFPPSAAAFDSARVRRLLDEHGLRLAAVGTGAGWVKHRLHFTLPEAAARQQARDFVRSIIDVAGPFGAPAIIGSMQGRWSEGVRKDDALAYLVEAIDDLSAHARQYGVPLLFEPLNRYETNLVNTVADGLALTRRVSSGNVRLLCDLFHMNIEEVDLGEALRQAGPMLGHVHFVDSTRRAAGMGHLDFHPVIAALCAIDYQGYLSAEAYPYPDSLTAARQTRAAIRYWLST